MVLRTRENLQLLLLSPSDLAVERRTDLHIGVRCLSHSNRLLTIETVQERRNSSVRDRRIRVELTVRPAESNALLTSPNVGGVVRVISLHIRVRASRRQINLRGTSQAVQRNGQVAAGRVIINAKPILLARIDQLLISSPQNSLVVRVSSRNVSETLTDLLVRRLTSQSQVISSDALALTIRIVNGYENSVAAILIQLGAVNINGGLKCASCHTVSVQSDAIQSLTGRVAVSLSLREQNVHGSASRNLEILTLHTDSGRRAQINLVSTQGHRRRSSLSVLAVHRNKRLSAQCLAVRLIVIFRNVELESLHNIGAAGLQGTRRDVQNSRETAVGVAHVLAEESRVGGELSLRLSHRGAGRLAGRRINRTNRNNQRLATVVRNVLETGTVHGDLSVLRGIHRRSVVRQGRGINGGNIRNLQLSTNLIRGNPAVFSVITVTEHNIEGRAIGLQIVSVDRSGQVHGAVSRKGGGGNILNVEGVITRVVRRESNAFTLRNNVQAERLALNEVLGETGAANGHVAALENVKSAGGNLQTLRTLNLALRNSLGCYRSSSRCRKRGGEGQEHGASQGDGAAALGHVFG